MQAQQILACVEVFTHSDIYVRQEDKAACQPISVWRTLFDVVEQLFFCRRIFLGIVKCGKLVGLLCINFDDSRFHEISDAILKLIHPDDFVHHHYFPVDAPAKQPMQPQHPAPDPAEHFQSDMNGLMEELFDTVTKSVSVPLDRLTQAERTQIIAKLYDQGMFELRGAVQFTVHKLACSQASIYRYIKKVKSQTE